MSQTGRVVFWVVAIGLISAIILLLHAIEPKPTPLSFLAATLLIPPLLCVVNLCLNEFVIVFITLLALPALMQLQLHFEQFNASVIVLIAIASILGQVARLMYNCANRTALEDDYP